MEREKLVPVANDEICHEREEKQNKKERNSEVDRLRDVCDEDRLLFVVEEEVQCARRCVEVSLQHQCRFYAKFLISCCSLVSVADRSFPTGTESERDEKDGIRRVNS
jgi:hypothetical protein